MTIGCLKFDGDSHESSALVRNDSVVRGALPSSNSHLSLRWISLLSLQREKNLSCIPGEPGRFHRDFIMTERKSKGGNGKKW